MNYKEKLKKIQRRLKKAGFIYPEDKKPKILDEDRAFGCEIVSVNQGKKTDDGRKIISILVSYKGVYIPILFVTEYFADKKGEYQLKRALGYRLSTDIKNSTKEDKEVGRLVNLLEKGIGYMAFIDIYHTNTLIVDLLHKLKCAINASIEQKALRHYWLSYIRKTIEDIENLLKIHK